jgi:hypothetical protein
MEGVPCARDEAFLKRWRWLSSSLGRDEFFLLSPLVELLNLTAQEKSDLIALRALTGEPLPFSMPKFSE